MSRPSADIWLGEVRKAAFNPRTATSRNRLKNTKFLTIPSKRVSKSPSQDEAKIPDKTKLQESGIPKGPCLRHCPEANKSMRARSALALTCCSASIVTRSIISWDGHMYVRSVAVPVTMRS